MTNQIMRFFEYDHLYGDARAVSEQFCGFAQLMDNVLVDGPEKTVSLRKLLEAKDAAVRTTIYDGINNPLPE